MSKKVVFLLVGVVILVLSMMGGGFFLLLKKVASIEMQSVTAAAASDENENEVATLGHIFSLESMIVNLADEAGNRYLRVTMDFELENETIVEQVQKRLPQIKDALLRILPTRDVAILNSVNGKNDLRSEILVSLNEFFPKKVIQNLYFTEFVIQ